MPSGHFRKGILHLKPADKRIRERADDALRLLRALHRKLQPHRRRSDFPDGRPLMEKLKGLVL